MFLSRANRLPVATVIGALALAILTVSSCRARRPGPSSADEPMEAGDEIYLPTGDVRPPELVKSTTPEYPERARAAGVQGTVELKAVIETDGKVTNVSVVKSIPELDDAVVAAVKKWKYKPATKGGRPVRVYLTLTIDFKLP